MSFEIFDNNVCTDEIFATLGTMYSGGGEMTDNINSYAGEGVAKFADLAIQAYCNSTDMTYYD